MKKLIDLPETTVKKLKYISFHKKTDSKNYIQDLVISHVDRNYGAIMFFIKDTMPPPPKKRKHEKKKDA